MNKICAIVPLLMGLSFTGYKLFGWQLFGNLEPWEVSILAHMNFWDCLLDMLIAFVLCRITWAMLSNKIVGG